MHVPLAHSEAAVQGTPAAAAAHTPPLQVLLAQSAGCWHGPPATFRQPAIEPMQTVPARQNRVMPAESEQPHTLPGGKLPPFTQRGRFAVVQSVSALQMQPTGLVDVLHVAPRPLDVQSLVDWHSWH